MSFRLTNAPATFQQLINELVSEFLDLTVLAYHDGTLIYYEKSSLTRQARLSCTQECQRPQSHFYSFEMGFPARSYRIPQLLRPPSRSIHEPQSNPSRHGMAQSRQRS